MTLSIVLTHKQDCCQTFLIGVPDFNVCTIINTNTSISYITRYCRIQGNNIRYAFTYAPQVCHLLKMYTLSSQTEYTFNLKIKGIITKITKRGFTLFSLYESSIFSIVISIGQFI